MEKKDVVKLFMAARRVSTPCVAIETSDQRALEARLFAAIEKNGNGAPMISMDIVEGCVGRNKLGKDVVLGVMSPDPDEPETTPSAILTAAKHFPPKTILTMHNAHRFIIDAHVIQAIANLRDNWRTDTRTLVLLGPSFELPKELNVVMFEEPMPDDDQLTEILHATHQGAFPDEIGFFPGSISDRDDYIRQAINAARGLPAFDAEQLWAMSLTKEGLDMDSTWERQASMINQTKGLTFTRKGLTFDDIGGLDAFKEFMLAYGQEFGCIVFVDSLKSPLAM